MTLIKLLLLAAIVVVGLLAFRGSRKALHKVLWRAYVVLVVVAAGLSVLFPDTADLAGAVRRRGPRRGPAALRPRRHLHAGLGRALPPAQRARAALHPAGPDHRRPGRGAGPPGRAARVPAPRSHEGSGALRRAHVRGHAAAPDGLDPGGAAVPRHRRVRPRLPGRRGGPRPVGADRAAGRRARPRGRGPARHGRGGLAAVRVAEVHPVRQLPPRRGARRRAGGRRDRGGAVQPALLRGGRDGGRAVRRGRGRLRDARRVRADLRPGDRDLGVLPRADARRAVDPARVHGLDDPDARLHHVGAGPELHGDRHRADDLVRPARGRQRTARASLGAPAGVAGGRRGRRHGRAADPGPDVARGGRPRAGRLRRSPPARRGRARPHRPGGRLPGAGRPRHPGERRVVGLHRPVRGVPGRRGGLGVRGPGRVAAARRVDAADHRRLPVPREPGPDGRLRALPAGRGAVPRRRRTPYRRSRAGGRSSAPWP